MTHALRTPTPRPMWKPHRLRARYDSAPRRAGSAHQRERCVPSVCRVISTCVSFVLSSRRFVSTLGRFAAMSATGAPCASTPPPVRVPRLRRYGLNACRDEVSSLAVSYEVSRHRLENAHIDARAGFADDGTTRLAVGIARRGAPHVSIWRSVATYLIEPAERGWYTRCFADETALSRCVI
jgi:hypothetical protein